MPRRCWRCARRSGSRPTIRSRASSWPGRPSFPAISRAPGRFSIEKPQATTRRCRWPSSRWTSDRASSTRPGSCCGRSWRGERNSATGSRSSRGPRPRRIRTPRSWSSTRSSTRQAPPGPSAMPRRCSMSLRPAYPIRSPRSSSSSKSVWMAVSKPRCTKRRRSSPTPTSAWARPPKRASLPRIWSPGNRGSARTSSASAGR